MHMQLLQVRKPFHPSVVTLKYYVVLKENARQCFVIPSGFRDCSCKSSNIKFGTGLCAPHDCSILAGILMKATDENAP